MTMSHDALRDIFEQLSEIEIETLQNGSMSAAEAKNLYDNVISLHVKFVKNQIELVKSNEFDYVYGYDDDNYGAKFITQIPQKATDLRNTLKKLARSKSRTSNDFKFFEDYEEENEKMTKLRDLFEICHGIQDKVKSNEEKLKQIDSTVSGWNLVILTGCFVLLMLLTYRTISCYNKETNF